LLGVWLVDLTRGPTGAPSFPAKIRPQRAAVLSVVGISCAIAFAIASLNVWRIPSGPLSATDAAFVAGVRTLASNTSRADAIFVGLTSHRYTTVNAMLAYYLADRRAGVKVAMFNPGITNTERVQREMVQELLNTNTQILMLDAKAALISEQTNDSRILGSDVLDTYISANFVLVCTFGDTRVLAARERASIVTCADTTNERLLDVLAGIGPTR
jgi:hypothetical protein